jgi:hypothetical protein
MLGPFVHNEIGNQKKLKRMTKTTFTLTGALSRTEGTTNNPSLQNPAANDTNLNQFAVAQGGLAPAACGARILP